jgi:hypothetical protein
MNLERELEKIFFEILKLQVIGKNWKLKGSVRERIRWVWDNSDLTAGELCDALEIDLDALANILDGGCDRKGRPRVEQVDVWAENFKASLPLFIPIKITHL